jgi:hypothetical protein
MSVDLSNKYAHTEGRLWWAAEMVIETSFPLKDMLVREPVFP